MFNNKNIHSDRQPKRWSSSGFKPCCCAYYRLNSPTINPPWEERIWYTLTCNINVNISIISFFSFLAVIINLLLRNYRYVYSWCPSSTVICCLIITFRSNTTIIWIGYIYILNSINNLFLEGYFWTFNLPIHISAQTGYTIRKRCTGKYILNIMDWF